MKITGVPEPLELFEYWEHAIFVKSAVLDILIWKSMENTTKWVKNVTLHISEIFMFRKLLILSISLQGNPPLGEYLRVWNLFTYLLHL